MIGVLSFKLLCVSPSPRSAFPFFSSASLRLRVHLFSSPRLSVSAFSFCFFLLRASASPRSSFFLSASLRLRVQLLCFTPPRLCVSAFIFCFFLLRASASPRSAFVCYSLRASPSPRSSLFQLTVEHDQIRSDRRPAALPHHCRDLSAVIRGVIHQMLQ